MKKIIGLTVAFLLVFSFSLTAFAEEMPGGAFVGGDGLDIGGEPNHNELDIGGENSTSLSDAEQQQIETAYQEILALSQTDKNITAVTISTDGTLVWVEITDENDPEQLKVYAERFVKQYGAFVTVTDDIDSLSGNIEAGGGLDKGGELGSNPNPFNQIWIFSICGIFLLGIASFVFLRKRHVAALQTANGNVIASDSTGSRKATISALKDSEATPNVGMFNSIMQKIDNDTK